MPQLDIHMIDLHGKNRNKSKVENYDEIILDKSDILVDLTCRICQFEDTSSENLKNHMKQHTESTFKCETCNYEAVVDSELKTHNQSKHMEVKVDIHKIEPNVKVPIKFLCDQCEFSFKLNIQLRKHIQKIHENKKY